MRRHAFRDVPRSGALARGAALLSLSVVLLGAARPDDGKDGEKKPAQPPPQSGMQANNPQQEEMLRLFAEVERSLRATDVLLWEAGSGELPLTAAKDSGLADLLRNAQSRGRQTTQNIDRILELARQQSQRNSSQSSNRPDPSSPQRDQSSDPLSPRENTPEAGKQNPEPQRPEQDSQTESQPKQDQPGKPDPNDTNQPGPMRREETGPKAAAGNEADRWGELPQRVRELFRTEGGGDLPAQYRDWIDAYYRRLNRVR